MKPVTVAEIGINHNGRVALAKELIDLAKHCKFDYVKFQKRTIEKVYSEEELARPKKTQFGETYGDEKRGLEFGKEEYDEIDAYCKEVGIGWFASVWDTEAVDFICQYDVPFLKLASCCCNHIELLEKVKKTNRRVVLSIGMSTEKDVLDAIHILNPNIDYILSTTSIYPCPDRLVELKKIESTEKAYGYWARKGVGFSSHSEKIIYPVVAQFLGAKMIEFHITMNHRLEGPDHKSSVGPQGAERIAKHLQSIHNGMGIGLMMPFEEEMEKGKKYSWRK